MAKANNAPAKENKVQDTEKTVTPVKNEKNTKKSSRKKLPFIKLMIIAVVFVGVIGVIIALVKFNDKDIQSRYATTTIEFNYDGATMNKTPSGENFSIAYMIDEKNIESALKKLGLDGKYSTEAIQKSIEISASYPDNIIGKIKQYNSLFDFNSSREVSVNQYYPTVYSITLFDDFDSSVSQSDLSAISSELVNCYKEYFVNKYVNVFDMTEYDDMFKLDGYDYAQRVKVLSFRADMIMEYASELYAADSGFLYNNMSFNDMFVRCSDLKNNSLTKVDALVTMNSLSTNKERLKNQYEYEIQLLTNELNNKNVLLTELDSLVENYETDDILYISAGENVTKIDSNSTVTYEALMDQRNEITDRITEINSELDKYNTYLQDLTGGSTVTTLNTDVSGKISDVAAQLSELEVMFKSMILEYNRKLNLDENISVGDTGYVAPKLVSGSFIVMCIKCAGPLCMLVMLIFSILGLIFECKKYKVSME